MIIEETFSVDAPRTEVARFFLDVPRMAGCVPGVEGLRHVDDHRYEATFVVRVGPIQARFLGDVTIDESEAPETILAIANGRDSTTGSVAQISFTGHLIQSGEGSTEIRTSSDVSMRGRLGQFGAGVITTTAHPSTEQVPRTGTEVRQAADADHRVPLGRRCRPHAEDLARTIPGSALVETSAPSHFFWIGPHHSETADAINGFLTGNPS